MRWYRGLNGLRAGGAALALAAAMAQGCIDNDHAVRCYDALDCPFGTQCTGHVCSSGPGLLRPGAHHEAGADAHASDAAQDDASGDGAAPSGDAGDGATVDGATDALSADGATVDGATDALSADGATDAPVDGGDAADALFTLADGARDALAE